MEVKTESDLSELDRVAAQLQLAGALASDAFAAFQAEASRGNFVKFMAAQNQVRRLTRRLAKLKNPHSLRNRGAANARALKRIMSV